MINYMSHRITKILGLVAFTGSMGLLEAQSTFTWNPAGPVYTAGRSRNMVVDKADPTSKTLYVGSTSSGVFKTTDGGINWAPLDDQGTVRNISYMAQDKNNKIWVSTGEGFLRFGQKAKAQKGTGLYTLNGTSFTLVQPASVVGEVITRIACDPNDANRIALATNKGILVSTNAGGTFTTLALNGFTANLSFVSGMDVKFSGDGTLYCSAGSEIAYSTYGTVYSQVYKSDAQLTTLTEITPTNSAVPDKKYGRIELAVAPSNNNVIYASCAVKAGGDPNTEVLGAQATAVLKALYVTYDGGANWGLVLHGSSQNDPLSNGGSIASGDYAHVILVNPVNPDQLFIGGYTFAIYTRTAGTNSNPIGTWARPTFQGFPNIPVYVHENIHDIKIVPNGSNPPLFYFITDAGIYRSVDLAANNPLLPPSFQPFYKGLVTGQFNSVSIDRFPIGANTSTNATKGSKVTPYSGFIGGTGGNGLVYYSGTYSLVTQETPYVGGEIYNAEYSKILDGAAIMSTGGGALFRSTDIKTSNPNIIKYNSYSGPISELKPASGNMYNEEILTGTPFRLWENYGQIANSPDKAIFFNDTLRFTYSFIGIPTLTQSTTFTFSAGRPDFAGRALIDSIVVRTGTVVLPTASLSKSPPFTGSMLKDINIKLANNYPVTNSITIPPIVQVKGPDNQTSVAGVTLNAATKTDIISVTFPSPPFGSTSFTTPYLPYPGPASLAVVPDAAAYYRVFATVFYKYKAGDPVQVIDNNISTKTATYTGVLDTDKRWTRTYTNLNPNPTGPKTAINAESVVNMATNAPFKMPTTRSARLAVILKLPAITNGAFAVVVSKAPLNLNDPLNFVRVSQTGCYSDNSAGLPTTNTINIPGKPILLEWSKGGTEIYYATNDNKVYRVSHINDIMDLSQSSYSGKFHTDIYKYDNGTNMTALNPASPYRTTLIGTFPKPISSISVSNDDKTLMVTLTGSLAGNSVMMNTNDARVSDQSNIAWVPKGANATAPFLDVNTYCSIMVGKDTALVGTDNGVAFTGNLSSSSPTWKNINDVSADGGKLPNVQVFDIKQQTMDPWDCYNSGQIYIATYGRGIWTTGSLLKSFYVDVNNYDRELKENSLHLFPNPTNNKVNVQFLGIEGETASVQVMDISGRLVKSEELGKLGYGEVTKTIELDELHTGVYLVNIASSSGQKRIAKLIVTK